MAGSSVTVLGDWDADGVVSAALVRYAQLVKKAYPVRGEVEEFVAAPTGPRGLRERLGEMASAGRCTDVLVVLDVPYTRPLASALRGFRSSCPGTRVIYVDHHLSTIVAISGLEGLVDELLVSHKPTSLMVHNLLRSLGVGLTPRLEAFVAAVAGLERSGVRPEVGKQMLDFAAAISKALTVLKDAEVWSKLVEWLSSPLPFGEPPVPRRVVERALEVASRAEAEVREKARDLAMSAERLGYIRFVDARRSWRRRGASALASRIHRILGAPVALLVGADDPLLIVRTKGRGAYVIAMGLLRLGLADDVGGHLGLAVVRLKRGVDLGELKSALRRLSLRI